MLVRNYYLLVGRASSLLKLPLTLLSQNVSGIAGSSTEENVRVHSSILKDIYESASDKKSEEIIKNQLIDNTSPEDDGIHPDWFAMERRVKSRKPRPRTGI